MDAKLEKLVRKAAVLAGQFYATRGYISPFFYLERIGRKRIIFDPDARGFIVRGRMDDRTKNAIVYAAEMIMAMLQVDRYVYFAESWVVSAGPDATEEEIRSIQDFIDTVGIAHHPLRMEVVNFEAEDMDGNKISGRQSIIRPKGFMPYLDDDLTLDDATEWESVGRFADLLAFRKYCERTRS